MIAGIPHLYQQDISVTHVECPHRGIALVATDFRHHAVFIHLTRVMSAERTYLRLHRSPSGTNVFSGYAIRTAVGTIPHYGGYHLLRIRVVPRATPPSETVRLGSRTLGASGNMLHDILVRFINKSLLTKGAHQRIRIRGMSSAYAFCRIHM